jgi:hypothetical protein
MKAKKKPAGKRVGSNDGLGKSLYFTVDAPHLLAQIHIELSYMGIAGGGLLTGLTIVRQTLAKMGQHAIDKNDKKLLDMMLKIGVVKPNAALSSGPRKD